jgi:hypothetical protein
LNDDDRSRSHQARPVQKIKRAPFRGLGWWLPDDKSEAMMVAKPLFPSSHDVLPRHMVIY